MRFADICFITEDVARLKAFYGQVFGKEAEGDDVHAWIMLDGLPLTFDAASVLKDTDAFRYVSGKGSDNVVVSFDVDDVDAEYARLLSLGVDTLNAPVTHPWGARSFQFRDPDGHILNFRMLPGAE